MSPVMHCYNLMYLIVGFILLLASRYAQKWAVEESSPAIQVKIMWATHDIIVVCIIQDVIIQSHEVTLLWLEAQKEYVGMLPVMM